MEYTGTDNRSVYAVSTSHLPVLSSCLRRDKRAMKKSNSIQTYNQIKQ